MSEPTEPTDVSNMVEVPPPGAPARPGVIAQVGGPLGMVVQLMQAGLPPAELPKMIQDFMTAQMTWEAEQARKAYVEAMAEFKRNPPTIYKQKLVDFQNRGGNRTQYKHATLGDVCDAVVEALAQFGFSHRWQTRSTPDGIYVTCICTHVRGHSEAFELGPARPDDSGGKNAIQAIASTQTYLQRYTLLGVIGLTSNDMRDDDAKGGNERIEVAAAWVEKALRAKDLAELSQTKDDGFAVFKKINDPAGFKSFKDAIQARRAKLDPEFAKKLQAKQQPAEEAAEASAEREPGSEG